MSILRESVELVALDVSWDLKLASALHKVVRFEDVRVFGELLKNFELFLWRSILVFL